jgi:hypothetical protein
MRNGVYDDGTPNELEPGAMLASELERLVEHPRLEEARLARVADAGEEAATVPIEIVKVAMIVIPTVLIVIALALSVYFGFR